jgi:hypothetical protein
VSATVVAATVGVAAPLPVVTVTVDRAEMVLASLEERAATWNRRDIEREAAAVLREAGARVDGTSVKTLVAAVEAHAESVSLAFADVGGTVPAALRRADGTSVFTRRGEQLFTSKAILDAERDLAALAAVRSLPAAETHRRFRAGWAELEDNDLVKRVAGAVAQIASLDESIAQAEIARPDLDRVAAEAGAAAAKARQ